MYEELILHLRECAKLDPSENTYKEAADAIEKLSNEVDRWKAEAKDWYLAYMDLLPTRWISVEERLPEEDGEYLVWFRPDEEDAEPFYGIFPFDANVPAFGFWQEQYDPVTYGWAGSDFSPLVGVTHWMPLPQPPKEET